MAKISSVNVEINLEVLMIRRCVNAKIDMIPI